MKNQPEFKPPIKKFCTADNEDFEYLVSNGEAIEMLETKVAWWIFNINSGFIRLYSFLAIFGNIFSMRGLDKLRGLS